VSVGSESGIQWTSIDAPKTIPPRFRWIGWLVILGIFGALVTFALIEGDKIVRDVAGGVVRSGVVAALDLPDTQKVDVDLGGGLLVFQAITGKLDSVDVTVPDVAFGEAVGTLALTVTAVPLDPGKPVGTLTADVLIDEGNLAKYAAYLSSVPLTSVVLADQFATVGADLAGVPVTVALAPSVATGAVVFTPAAVTAGGVASTVEEIAAGPLAPLAAPMLASRPLCVAQYLPKALTVTGAAVTGKNLVITATGANVGLASLGTKGTCEPPVA
jgi:hypothetical protein